MRRLVIPLVNLVLLVKNCADDVAGAACGITPVTLLIEVRGRSCAARSTSIFKMNETEGFIWVTICSVLYLMAYYLQLRLFDFFIYKPI